MIPMRERLCVAACKHEMRLGGQPPYPDHLWLAPDAVLAAVETYGTFVDAILAELRNPDEGMVEAGMELAAVDLTAEFTAMIDHVRAGK